MIALIPRGGGDDKPEKAHRTVQYIWPPKIQKVRNAFEQRVNDVDRPKKAKKCKEGTMIGVEMGFVIDGFICAACARE